MTCEDCNKNKRQMFYEPCEHFTLCEECFNKKEDKTKCEICHKNIKITQKIIAN